MTKGIKLNLKRKYMITRHFDRVFVREILISFKKKFNFLTGIKTSPPDQIFPRDILIRFVITWWRITMRLWQNG